MSLSVTCVPRRELGGTKLPLKGHAMMRLRMLIVSLALPTVGFAADDPRQSKTA
jgi:hypothetical protein